jgi:hypothetical protein
MAEEARLVWVDTAREEPVVWVAGLVGESGLLDMAESEAARIAQRGTVPADTDTAWAADRESGQEPIGPKEVRSASTVVEGIAEEFAERDQEHNPAAELRRL